MIRKLMRSIREYKRDTILTPVTISVEVIMECLIPMLMAELIDNGIYRQDMAYIWKMGGLLLLCAIASLGFGTISGTLAARASAGFAKNLREDMYRNIQSFSFANIDKFSTGGLVTRLTTDVTNVQNAFQMIIRTAVRCPFMFVFSFVMSVKLGGNLAWIFVAVIPVLAVGLFFVARGAHSIFKRVFKTYDRLNTVVQENLHGIRVVKAFVQEKAEEKKFTEISERIRADFTKAEKILAWNSPLMQGAIYIGMLLLCWFGAQAVVASGNDAAMGVSTGELTSLFTYAMQILASLMMLSFMFVMVVISKASGDRVVEVLEEKSTITSPENAVKEVRDGSVEFRHVKFRYNQESERPVLDDINLKIESGWTVGILGGTGSSKSSLVQLIPRLYDTEEGTVLVGGRDVKEYDLEALRNEVAFVLQKNELFSGTIAENLRWGNEHATDGEIIHACQLAQADSFIQTFPDGYDTHIEQGGTNVSGGQKQRLCIARALLKNPKVLILDDSTSAVDTATDAAIRQGFREFIPSVTKIIIAQRVASVQDADRILVLDAGRVSAFGTHEELLKTSPIYREVYETQTRSSEKKEGEPV